MSIINIISYFRNNSTSIIRFLSIGLFTFIVNIIFLYAFYDLLKFDYKISISISYVIGMMMQFQLNKKYTFQVNQFKFKYILKYLNLPLINYVQTILISLIIVGYFNYTPYFSVIISTAVSALISYVYMKHFVFNN